MLKTSVSHTDVAKMERKWLIKKDLTVHVKNLNMDVVHSQKTLKKEKLTKKVQIVQLNVQFPLSVVAQTEKKRK